MGKTIDHLLKNSGLPGPRGNLELLYSFAKSATAEEVEECMAFYDDGLHNSPEEFVVMCGIVGRCVLQRGDPKKALASVRAFAVHESWRIREAVAIGIQEIAADNTHTIIDLLERWMDGNALERRAVVAALCEPKLLKDRTVSARLLGVLGRITMDFERAERLTDGQVALRKALGYGWSVAVAASPEVGKAAFEAIALNPGKHIRWIVRENLKKRRLTGMDARWVECMLTATA